MEMAQSTVEPKAFRFRHSDALLRSILENAAVATFMVGADNRLIYANHAFTELLGYAPEEAVGIGIDEVVDPSDAELAREQARSVVDGGAGGYSAERRYRRKDGSTVWVAVRANSMRDEKTGEHRYIVVQSINIDRRKQAEAALAASENRWNFALESAGQGVWDQDLDGRTGFFSRAWREMRGIGSDEPIAFDHWFTTMHPDDQLRIGGILERQRAGAVDRNEFEYRARHRDGRWIWILSRGKPAAWRPDGTPSRYVGIDTDITRLKTAELQAAFEKERLTVTLEAIADGVISTDSNGRVTFMNQAAEDLTGWSTSEARTRDVSEIFKVVDGTTGEPIADPVRECLTSGRVCALETEPVLLKRNRDRCDIRTTASPLRSPQGGIIGSVLVFQDVTDTRSRHRELAHTAMHDSLTGLPNRASFARALAEGAQQAGDEAREHALCFVDLDRFKSVNDNAGHTAGDTLLQTIATTIRSSCRTIDLVARIGGDEFALLLPDCSKIGALRVAQKVIDAIAGLDMSWEGKTYQVGASIGIAAITSECTAPDELMRRADAACYVAKANGRNQVAFYDGVTPGLEQLSRSA